MPPEPHAGSYTRPECGSRISTSVRTSTGGVKNSPPRLPSAFANFSRKYSYTSPSRSRAFVAPYVLDARRCISYLTIELKGPIPEELRAPIGNRVFGCDDCQIVCPWNRFARPTEQGDFLPRHGLDSSALADLFLWSEDEFLSRTEGSPLRRAGYERWLRNLAVGLGNAPSTIAVLEALQTRREHPSELVREHVAWALARHHGKGPH